jgi:hypothetical protein
VTGLGAGATFAGVAVGAYLAAMYGRRGSVSVSGVAHALPSGVVVTARPCVKAVGLFRVKFQEEGGATVRLTELCKVGLDLKEGFEWEQSGVFGQQYVDAGEELRTTVIFQPGLRPEVVGWNLYLRVEATTRLFKSRTGWWADQVFVPRDSGI